MSKSYVYVVARDFGFAPNPFHGVCTLATCKPVIRRKADVGDWIIGMGGSELKATGRAIFAMKVTDTMSFDAYWRDPVFRSKRCVRNGSHKMMNGDNIYHRAANGGWLQADSHHSKPDGSPEPHNIRRDTSTDRVLLSRHFLYFGSEAPTVPADLLAVIGWKNQLGHRVSGGGRCDALISWLLATGALNEISGDPFQFAKAAMRYSGQQNKVVS